MRLINDFLDKGKALSPHFFKRRKFRQKEAVYMVGLGKVFFFAIYVKNYNDFYDFELIKSRPDPVV